MFTHYEQLLASALTEAEAAQGALEDLSHEQREVEVEPDLGDAEQDVLERLAQLRAATAGEIGGGEDLAATQSAIRRIFEYFILRPINRAWMENPPAVEGEAVLIGRPGADAAMSAECELLPVLRADGIALTTLAPALQGESGMSASVS